MLDMSTVSPDFARDASERTRDSGRRHLDACVYGAPMHARSGELRVMVGGEEEDFHSGRGRSSTRSARSSPTSAPSGMGATMKLVVNMLMGVQMPALAEAVVFGERAGLPREAILDMIAGSGYASPVMSFRCPMMGRRAFDNPAFRLSLMRKDMMLMLAESQRLGVPLPVSETAYAMLTAASSRASATSTWRRSWPSRSASPGMDDYPWPVDGGGNGGGLSAA